MTTTIDSDLACIAQNSSTASLSSPLQAVGPTTNVTVGGLAADEWVELIQEGLQSLTVGEPLNKKCLSAPRRRHADPNSAALALHLAGRLYPAPSDSLLPQVIKYEKGKFLPRLLWPSNRAISFFPSLEKDPY